MKAVFLDRDGTIIVEPPGERLVKEEDTELFPDTIEALNLLHKNGFAIVIITNQAGIAEGLINIEKFHELNGLVLEMIKPSGVEVLGTFICPHVAADNCDCRKPRPKMILDAAKEFDIDLKSSYMVGDRLGDIGAGMNAGAKTILVKTAAVPVTSDDATFTAQNLLEAAQFIISH